MTSKCDEASARSVVYRLLSRAFLGEPTAAFLADLSNEAVLLVFGKTGGGWMAQLPRRDHCVLAEELSVEYARLFLGPGSHAYPYESLYAGAEGYGSLGADVLLYGPAAREAEEFYRQAEIEFAPAFRGLPDHVGVELECMSHLAAREAAHWRTGNSSAASSTLRQEQVFLGKHLVLWLPKFSRQVRAFEAHPFYRAMAAVASRFVRVDLRAVDELLGNSIPDGEETGEPHESASSMYSGH